MLRAFSFYDTKTEVFSPPMFFRYEGEAIRAAIELGNDRATLIGRYPADYILFNVGSFNEQTGELSPAHARSLGPVLAMLNPPEPAPVAPRAEAEV